MRDQLLPPFTDATVFKHIEVVGGHLATQNFNCIYNCIHLNILNYWSKEKNLRIKTLKNILLEIINSKVDSDNLVVSIEIRLVT